MTTRRAAGCGQADSAVFSGVDHRTVMAPFLLPPGGNFNDRQASEGSNA